jgi:hypothetical protein
LPVFSVYIMLIFDALNGGIIKNCSIFERNDRVK